jgi:hypothetical protein
LGAVAFLAAYLIRRDGICFGKIEVPHIPFGTRGIHASFECDRPARPECRCRREERISGLLKVLAQVADVA